MRTILVWLETHCGLSAQSDQYAHSLRFFFSFFSHSLNKYTAEFTRARPVCYPPPHQQSHAARARAGRHHEEGCDAAARGEGLQVGSFPFFAQCVRLVGARERLVKEKGADPQTQLCALAAAGVSTTVGPARLRHTSLVVRRAPEPKGAA